MRKKFSHFSLMASIGVFAFAAVGIASCSNGLISSATVKLSDDEIEIEVGESYELTATLSKGYDSELLWSSSNENFVIVRSGFVFGVGVGNATVTAYYGGGHAECKVTVKDSEGGGGGGQTKVDYLSISPTSKKCNVGDSFVIDYSVYPEDTTVSFSSKNEEVASVTQEGRVTAIASGTVNIVVTGSNNKVATCALTVASESDPTIRDIGVEEKDFNISGVSLRVGAPKNQVAKMKEWLSDFNTLTKSTISFTVSEFEEGDGVSNLPTAQSAPDIFPYASDQTLSFFQLGALATISKSDSKWIENNMGKDALNAAKLSNVVGYPFTSDNGSVLFYDKTLISDPAQLETLDALYARADELGEIDEDTGKPIGYTVDIGYGNTFLGAGYLQSYAGGESLYKLTPTNTSYKSTSNFNSEAGLKGARLLYNIINRNASRNSARTPGAKNEVLATVIDVSKVAALKAEMGDKYATAPLPYIDANKTVRLGSYLGYKFYGINNTLDKSSQAAASCVARFLCSEYVQAKRYDEFRARPTLTSLQDYASGESHIASLVEQSKNNGTIQLNACGLELWSEVGTAITSIKAFKAEPSDAELTKILEVLDAALTKQL